MSALLKRLERELTSFKSNPPENITLDLIDKSNYLHWKASFFGPPDSPYEGGTFFLDIIIPEDYPFVPPKIKFITRVYHPNIDLNGTISLDILDYNWTMALTIEKVVLSISSLLTDPNPDDPLVPEIAELYKENIIQYEANAKEWTKKYAW